MVGLKKKRKEILCNLSTPFFISSDCFDVPTTADVCDVDMDGTKEILLGTFGGEILIFKETKRTILVELLRRTAWSVCAKFPGFFF